MFHLSLRKIITLLVLLLSKCSAVLYVTSDVPKMQMITLTDILSLMSVKMSVEILFYCQAIRRNVLNFTALWILKVSH